MSYRSIQDRELSRCQQSPLTPVYRLLSFMTRQETVSSNELYGSDIVSYSTENFRSYLLQQAEVFCTGER